MAKINLTQYTNAGGCGCKIAPKALSDIIKSVRIQADSKGLLAGNYLYEDAAVINKLGDQTLVFTDDFFTPIVDDPFFFGKIAACNALSDIYAMGATPRVALSILGWPVDRVPIKFARRVLEGAKSVCDDVNVKLAGGHSINNPQPIFGLSVIGSINPKNLKLNSTAKKNDLIYLTKPLGSGIYATAHKMGKLSYKGKSEMLNTMTQLNDIGIKISKMDYVNSMTDITGFGLLGHLVEVCKASKLRAEVFFENIVLLSKIESLLGDGIISSGGTRNWQSYKSLIGETDTFKSSILSDPQTNGGLLISIRENSKVRFETFLKKNNLEAYSKPIGVLKSNLRNTKKIVLVK